MTRWESQHVQNLHTFHSEAYQSEGMNNEAEDTDSEATTGDDLLLWYFLEDSEDDKASPLWVWVCVLVVIAVAFIVALCS